MDSLAQSRRAGTTRRSDHRARVPHTAVRILSKALETGPVLLSIPQDGITEALSCSKCHRQVRCARCTGPLERVGGRNDSMPLVRRRHRAMVMPDMP